MPSATATATASRALDFVRPGRLLLAASIAWASAAYAEDLQPRSYAYLLSHASVVAVGTVTGVSTGFLSQGRKATLSVEGLVKGRLRAREMVIAWDDEDFEETAYRDHAKVVVFAEMRKDSTFAQIAPGISCWPVEKIDFKGKRLRAVEYAYPLDLITNVPSRVLRETEEVEKSMNFRVAKRKKWILADQLLPPVRPLVLPKAPKPASPRPKPVAKGKDAKRGAKPKSLF